MVLQTSSQIGCSVDTAVFQVGPVTGKSTWGFWLPRSKGKKVKRQPDDKIGKVKAAQCFENREGQELFQHKLFQESSYSIALWCLPTLEATEGRLFWSGYRGWPLIRHSKQCKMATCA